MFKSVTDMTKIPSIIMEPLGFFAVEKTDIILLRTKGKKKGEVKQ